MFLARLNLFILIFLCLSNLQGQTLEAAGKLYKERQFDSALVEIKEFLKKVPLHGEGNVLAGRILAAQGKFSEAEDYLLKGFRTEEGPMFSKAWAMRELAACYFVKGDSVKSKMFLQNCISLNATKNATISCENLMLRFGYDKLFQNWTKKESMHFIFHFQDTSTIKNINRYIERKELAFDSINGFFHSDLPKKIDYFIWTNDKEAEELFKHRLAFSESNLCLTHTSTTNTLGHEMTHSISFYAGPIYKQTKLIGEGVCVYFDLSNRNNIQMIRNKSQSKISIIEIWKNGESDDILYPLGGELVKRLIDNFGREKFMMLLSNQSYENALKIYGQELNTLINALEKDIN